MTVPAEAVGCLIIVKTKFVPKFVVKAAVTVLLLVITTVLVRFVLLSTVPVHPKNLFVPEGWATSVTTSFVVREDVPGGGVVVPEPVTLMVKIIPGGGLVTLPLELPSGNVRWRLLSVGISGIQFDQSGLLYVSSTTGSPEDIQFSEQIKINDAAKPMLLKVDPKSGKTLWKTEQTGGNCFLTGKYVYLTDASRGGFAMINAIEESFGVIGRSGGSFNVYRINPASGKTLWAFNKAEAPSSIDFANNRILLQNGRNVEVLKFLSF